MEIKEEIEDVLLNCHICGELTDCLCEDCGNPVCDGCLSPFKQYKGVEYNQCQSCEE
ncbi:MAG: hypothetical protein KAT66_00420 [Candidatus Lokiarchaeota archaeon]|nr:hypothetical protein [Candidatus Lokiarchaeota archaeon]